MSQSYALLHDQLLQKKGHIFNLNQLVGEHALGMVQMIQGYCRANPTEMMDGWAAVDGAKRSWARVITNGQDPNSEFCQVASNMLSSWCNALRDHIVQPNGNNDLITTRATTKACAFHAGCSEIPVDMRQSDWTSHTRSFLRLLSVSKTHGTESDSFHTCAADCLKSAQLLGRQLDYDIFSR